MLMAFAQRTRACRTALQASQFTTSASRRAAATGKNETDELISKVLERVQKDRNFIRKVFEKAPDNSVRQNLVRPIASQVGRVLDKEFSLADVDGNRQLSVMELRNWYKQKYPSFEAGAAGTASREAAEAEKAGAASVAEPTRQQLMQLSVQAGIPFIGFGILDNAIMLTAGNQIEASMGVALGMSPLMAAGFGNLISDVAGLKAGGIIESVAAKMGLPDPGLTTEQLRLNSVKRVSLFSGAVGIAIGCIIGLFPLLFIDENRNMLREVFESIDHDHSGTLSEDELFAALGSVGVKREVVHELIKHADLDGSEDIDFDEFCKLYSLWKSGSVKLVGSSSESHASQ